MVVTPPQKILGLFHLKWLMLVQIQLYFNRNVRLFTARTTTVTCIHVLLAAEGGSIEPVEPPLATGLHYDVYVYVGQVPEIKLMMMMTTGNCLL